MSAAVIGAKNWGRFHAREYSKIFGSSEQVILVNTTTASAEQSAARVREVSPEGVVTDFAACYGGGLNSLPYSFSDSDFQRVRVTTRF